MIHTWLFLHVVQHYNTNGSYLLRSILVDDKAQIHQNWKCTSLEVISVYVTFNFVLKGYVCFVFYFNEYCIELGFDLLNDVMMCRLEYIWSLSTRSSDQWLLLHSWKRILLDYNYQWNEEGTIEENMIGYSMIIIQFCAFYVYLCKQNVIQQIEFVVHGVWI